MLTKHTWDIIGRCRCVKINWYKILPKSAQTNWSVLFSPRVKILIGLSTNRKQIQYVWKQMQIDFWCNTLFVISHSAVNKHWPACRFLFGVLSHLKISDHQTHFNTRQLSIIRANKRIQMTTVKRLLKSKKAIKIKLSLSGKRNYPCVWHILRQQQPSKVCDNWQQLF